MEHKFGIVSGMTAPSKGFEVVGIPCVLRERCPIPHQPLQDPQTFSPHPCAGSSSCLGASRGIWGSLPWQKQRVDRLVWQPLCSLSDMLEGPQQLVKKRLDKLLDYEEIQERKSEMGSVSYDEEAAMNTYLAINDLLVAELPHFNQVALQLLGQILRSFSALQLDLAAQALHYAEKELEQVSGTPQEQELSWNCLLQVWEISQTSGFAVGQLPLKTHICKDVPSFLPAWGKPNFLLCTVRNCPAFCLWTLLVIY